MTPKPSTLDFYFDYLSPYAFFAWLQVEPFARQHHMSLNLQPVLFPALLNHWGQLGPAEIPPKRLFAFKDIQRLAKRHGVTLKGPKTHPYNPLLALRLSLKEVAGEHQEKLVAALWHFGWGEGGDYGDDTQIAAALEQAHLPAADLLEKARSPQAKEALRQHTQAAIDQGVFGVPTMLLGEELFWGQDQFEHMAMFLRGDDPPGVAAIAEMMGRVSGVKRQKHQAHGNR